MPSVAAAARSEDIGSRNYHDVLNRVRRARSCRNGLSLVVMGRIEHREVDLPDFAVWNGDISRRPIVVHIEDINVYG